MLLLWITIAWVVGVLLGRYLWSQSIIGCSAPGLWAWVSLCAALIASAVLLRRKWPIRLPLTLLLFTALGLWRYQSHPINPLFGPDDLAFYNSSPDDPAWVEMTGTVDAYPDIRDRYTNYVFRVHALEIEGRRRSVDGLVLLQTDRFPEYEYGDELRVQGVLTTPPVFDDFSYREYLARKSIYSLIRYARTERVSTEQGSHWRSALYDVRSYASKTINRILPEPQASLLNGMLLGIESGIPEPLYDDFRATGTVHFIVISGFNITVIAGLLSRMMLRVVGRRWVIYPVVAGIVVYALLAGAEPPVVRAAIMGILYVWAIHLGRESTAAVSLSAAGLVLTAINPLALWDVGFQLSTAGTLGLIVLTPTLSQRFRELVESRKWSGWASSLALWVGDSLIVTTAAQVATLPILLAYFGQLSTVSLLGNLLVVATQPPILIFGGLAMVAGLVWVPFGTAFAALPWLLLAYTVEVVQLLARVPNATVAVGTVGPWFVWGTYALLAGIVALAVKWRDLGRSAQRTVRRAVALSAAAILCTWLGFTLSSSLPDGLLHVWYIGLGDSDVTLIQTPSGQSLLIDAGKGDRDAASEVRHALGGVSRRLDLLILTQDSEERQAAASCLLSRLRVERVFAPTGSSGTGLWQTKAKFANAWLVEPLLPNTVISLDDGLVLEVLHASEPGRKPDGAVLRLAWGEVKLLLPSEIEQPTQERLLQSGVDLHSTVLKTAHQGTGNWPTAAFLDAVHPQLVLVPNDTSYPPATNRSLASRPGSFVDPSEIVEIVSNGSQFEVRSHSSAELTIR